MKKTKIIVSTIGKIQGYIHEDILIFKDIPFVEPTFRDLCLNKLIPKSS
ncbi:MAG: hypothetical protein ACFFG0_53085 [Candidatus Thorarchaeota archaeon]